MSLLVALFLSGCAALVYEVCWIRRATLVFGATVPALSTVLAVFFGGLAIGSEFFGRRAARLRRPLVTFAVIEIALATWALLTPWAFDLLHVWFGRAYRAVGLDGGALAAIRVGLTALVLLPATFLMGASLPLFTRGLVTDHVVRGVGAMYAANTLGAACGCALAGFLAVPALGVTWTLRLGAFAGGVAALIAWRSASRVQARATDLQRGPATTSRTRAAVAVLFFLVGLVALGEEILWTRYLSLLLRTTAITYTLTLTVVLAGIVLGSLAASRWFDRRRGLAVWFGAVQCASGLCVLAIMLLPPGAWARLGESLAVHLLLLLPPSILSGLSFPLAVRLFLGQDEGAAQGVGRMTALNTLGGIVGALMVGFWLLPALGLQRTLYLLTATSLGIGIAAWILAGLAPRTWILGAATAATLWALAPVVSDTRIPADHLEHDGRLIDFREGVAANVAVLEREEALHMEIDRWWQGSSHKSHQVMAAHVPMLLHEDPRSVLVIGMGTGQTPSRFLDYEIERLECVDIEPAVFELARAHFAGVWMNDRRFSALRTDGRNHVAHTNATYDVISLELGQLFRPGVASFYTIEFYEQVRDRLNEGGIVSQFVPMPFLDDERFRRVISTFLQVFRQSVLWYNTSELLLLGRVETPLTLAPERLALLETNEKVHEDLKFSHWGGPRHWLNRPEAFVAGFLCGPNGLTALASGRAAYRDDHPVLEYQTTHTSASTMHDAELVGLLEARLEPTSRIAPGFPRAEAADAIRARNLGDITAAAWLRQVPRLREHRDYAGLERVLEAATRANGENLQAHRLRGELELLRRNLDAARAAFERALAIDASDARSHRNLAQAAIQQGDLAEAAVHLRAALETMPDDAVTHNNLGAVLAQQGRFDEARVHFQRAVALRPDYGDALANLKKMP